MPIDQEQIMTAVKEFEGGNLAGAKDILKAQIASAKNDFLKDRLQLEKDPIAVPAAKPEENNVEA